MRALILVLNNFTHDSRVLRQAATLTTCGYEVAVFALHREGLPRNECCATYRLRRFKLLTKALPRHKAIQVVKYCECVLQMVWQAFRWRPEVVHANDLDCLPIGVLVKYLCRAHLVYDAHELWSNAEYASPYPKWLSWLMEGVEKSMTRRADRVMTVCDSIAQHMSETLRIPMPKVVRNVPVCELVTHQDISPLREIASIAHGVPVILNLGMISHGRGIETLLKALQRIDPPAMAVFLGSADTSATVHGKPTYLESLRTLAQQLGVANRVRFVPSVPPKDVHCYTTGGTIGVAPIEPTCLSYCYCLPNKLFQYIQAGLPVVTSDLPEMAKVVHHYEIGEVFPAGDSDRLAVALNSLLNDPAKLKLCQENSAKAAQELNWNKEQVKLIAIYEQLNGTNSPAPQVCA